jgi:hypothetical protein
MNAALPTLGHYRHRHDVRAVLIYCVNSRCHHRATLNVDFLPDDTVLKSLEPRMVCTACGIVGADVRPDWAGMSNVGSVPLSYLRAR